MIKVNFTAFYGHMREPVHVHEWWPNGSTTHATPYYVITFEDGGERVRCSPDRLMHFSAREAAAILAGKIE